MRRRTSSVVEAGVQVEVEARMAVIAVTKARNAIQKVHDEL